MVKDYLDYYLKVCSKLDKRNCKKCEFKDCPYKGYKEKSNRPKDEIPISFVPDYNEENGNRNSLERRQFKEEESIHFRSKKRQLFERRNKKINSRLARIVIKCLHKHKEKAIFNLYFVERKSLREVAKILKMSREEVHTEIETVLKKKFFKIYQNYQLFKSLKNKFKEILTKKQYQAFELYYNEWYSRKEISKRLNVPAIFHRFEWGEKKLRKKMESKNYQQYLRLKKIRFNRVSKTP